MRLCWILDKSQPCRSGTWSLSLRRQHICSHKASRLRSPRARSFQSGKGTHWKCGHLLVWPQICRSGTWSHCQRRQHICSHKASRLRSPRARSFQSGKGTHWKRDLLLFQAQPCMLGNQPFLHYMLHKNMGMYYQHKLHFHHHNILLNKDKNNPPYSYSI